MYRIRAYETLQQPKQEIPMIINPLTGTLSPNYEEEQVTFHNSEIYIISLCVHYATLKMIYLYEIFTPYYYCTIRISCLYGVP